MTPNSTPGRFESLDYLSSPPVTALEVQTVSLAVGAGLWLGLAQSFAFSSGPIYRFMRTANEWTWAFALLLGTILFVIGVAAAELRVRRLGLMLIALVWFLMCLCFVFGNPHAFTTWTYLVLAISAAYSSLRLQR